MKEVEKGREEKGNEEGVWREKRGGRRKEGEKRRGRTGRKERREKGVYSVP